MKRKSFLFVGALVMALALTGCVKNNVAKSKSSVEPSQAPSSIVEPSNPQSSVPAPTSSENKPSSVPQPSSQPASSANPTPSSRPVSSNPPSSKPVSSNPQPSSQPTPSSQSGSSVAPLTTKYYVSYDAREIALELENATLAESQSAQYRATLGNISKGKSIAILDANKAALSENFGAEPGDNNVSGEVGSFVIHNDAEGAFVIVKEWQSGWTNFYVSGYVADPIVEPVFKVVGSMNSWNYTNSEILFAEANKQEEIDAGLYVKQLKASFAINAKDEFKVSDGTNWLGGDIFEGHADFDVIKDDGESYNNIVARAKGNVDLYLKYLDTGALSLAIYFEKEVVEPVYKVVGTMNEWNYENSVITFADATDPEEVAANQYKTQLKASFKVAANDEFKVLDQLGNYFGGEILEANDHFNVLENKNIQAKEAGTVELFFKTFVNDTRGIYLGFTSDTPVPQIDFYASYNNNQIALEKADASITPSGCSAAYRASIGNVEKDKAFAILDSNKVEIGGEKVKPENNANLYNKDSHYYIHNNAEDATVIVFVWQSGWTTFYVSGFVADPVYKVVGTMNDWNYENSEITFTDVSVPAEVENNWYVWLIYTSFTVEKDAEFKILDQLGNYYGGEILENNANFSVLDNGDIKANKKGVADLYLKQYDNGNKWIYISFVASAVPTPTYEYYVEYDGDKFPATLVTDAPEVEHLVATYKVELGHVETDKRIAILDGYKVALEEKYGKDPATDNNVRGDVGSYVINNTADNVYVLIRVWDTPWVNFFVSGYELPPEPSYVVVGTVSSWAPIESNLDLTDATDPEEVAAGLYVKQLKATFNVDVDDEFKVCDYDGHYYGGEILETNVDFAVVNSADESNGNIKALAKGEATLYFKTYANGTRSIAIVLVKESVTPTDPIYKIVGSMNAWSYENSDIFFVDATLSEEVESGLYVTQLRASFNITLNDEFKISDQSGNFIGSSILEPHEKFTALDNGNIKANAVGEVSVYLKTLANGNKSIALGFQELVEDSVFKVVGTMNDWSYANSTITFEDASNQEEIDAGWYLAQAKAVFTVSANDEFKLLDQLGNYLGGEILEANDKFTVLDNGNIKAKADGTVTLYFKLLTNFNPALAISFEETVHTPETVTVTLKVTYDCGDGNSIYLLGAFCEWDITNEKAIKFTWTEGNVWVAEVSLNTYTEYACKLVIAPSENPESKDVHYENGSNRALIVTAAGEYVLTWQN